MYYVRVLNNDKWYQVGTFSSYDKAFYYVKYNFIIYNIPLDSFQIIHKGMVLTVNESSFKKVFK